MGKDAVLVTIVISIQQPLTQGHNTKIIVPPELHKNVIIDLFIQVTYLLQLGLFDAVYATNADKLTFNNKIIISNYYFQNAKS